MLPLAACSALASDGTTCTSWVQIAQPAIDTTTWTRTFGLGFGGGMELWAAGFGLGTMLALLRKAR